MFFYLVKFYHVVFSIEGNLYLNLEAEEHNHHKGVRDSRKEVSDAGRFGALV